jgi:hypothetical protein
MSEIKVKDSGKWIDCSDHKLMEKLGLEKIKINEDKLKKHHEQFLYWLRRWYCGR